MILWLLLVQCLLWQEWVRERYAGTVDAVMGHFGLARREGWRSGLLLEGVVRGHKVQISWKGSPCAVRARIKVKHGWRKRRWSTLPCATTERLVEKAEELIGD